MFSTGPRQFIEGERFVASVDLKEIVRGAACDCTQAFDAQFTLRARFGRVYAAIGRCPRFGGIAAGLMGGSGHNPGRLLLSWTLGGVSGQVGLASPSVPLGYR